MTGADTGPPANPFTPGPGRIPPCWAYGGHPLRKLRKHMREMLSDAVGVELHLHGPPGCGKNALLAQIAADARREGAHIEPLAETPGGTRAEHRKRIEKAMGGGPAVALLSDTKRIPLRPEDLTVPGTAQDIADSLGVGEAFAAARDLERTGHPILLLVAGTPLEWEESPWNIPRDVPREIGSYHVGLMDPKEAADVLTCTAEASGLPLDEDAAAHLADECFGHPGLLQKLGARAWDTAKAAGDRRIRLATAEAAALAVRPETAHETVIRVAAAADAGLMGKCLALATALFNADRQADNPRSGPAKEFDTSARTHGMRIPATLKELVLDRVDLPPGLSADNALDLMTRFGLFHMDMDGVPFIEPSYPMVCEHLVDSLGRAIRKRGEAGGKRPQGSPGGGGKTARRRRPKTDKRRRRR